MAGIENREKSVKNDDEPTPVFAPRVTGPAPTNEATIVTLSNGGHRIFYINRPGEANRLMSVWSADGINWREPEVELELPGTAYYANRVMVDNKGVLHCIFHLWAEGGNGYRGRHLDLWYTRKENGTGTWKKPRKIYNGYVGSLRCFMQLRSGRLITSFGRAVPSRLAKPASGEPDYGWNEVLTLWSDDSGETWSEAPRPLNIEVDGSKATRYGAIEPDVIQLKDNNLRMLIRTNKGTLYESSSQDSGENWTVPKPSELVSSDSPAAFLRLKDGRIVLFLNMNQRWDNPNSYAFGGREVLHAAISGDDGKTWKGFREVLRESPPKTAVEKGDRGTAYPSATETSDGLVILVSGQGESKSIVRFDPDWLEETNTRTATGNAAKELSATTEWVQNFPISKKGEIEVKVDLKKNPPGLQVALADHFSIPADAMAADHAVFTFRLSPGQSMEGMQIMKIKWDTEAQTASIHLNDRLLAGPSLSKTSGSGVNYLRMKVISNGGKSESGIGINEFSYYQIP
ncbi:hypothetical protein GCM10023091_34650 [Ravibacter arvi]|uniref:Sialidase domain-containing protein n=2 Tax=Ravibacter arvi TaxID=2051041 RepID=A0ABP8M8N0_9BACT